MEFEWNERKNQTNIIKHGISFQEAQGVFNDPKLMTYVREEDMSNNQFSLDMSPEERHRKLVNMSDEDIDYSDIPELDEAFFENAKLVKRKPATEAISIRVDVDTLEWFRNYAKNHSEIRGYQTLINDVLRTYVAHKINRNS